MNTVHVFENPPSAVVRMLSAEDRKVEPVKPDIYGFRWKTLRFQGNIHLE